MDQDQLTLISVFCQGSAELLTACEESLMVLEARPSDGEALNRVLRNMHRLKGDSMLLDLVSFSKFAHVLEELLVHMRSKLIPVSSDVITFLLQGVDTLRKMASSFSGPTVTEKSGFQTQTAQAATPLSTVRVETEKLDR
jgi:two-component system chemotaxis sensor kinase CheA